MFRTRKFKNQKILKVKQLNIMIYLKDKNKVSVNLFKSKVSKENK